MSPDVLVIGGGPAGLAAAIAARFKGFDVTVVDSAQPPIDKSCGEGVLPAGIEILRRFGVQLSPGDGASVEASFQSGYGLGLRRTRLHQLLVDRASQLGVRLLWGNHVTEPAASSSCRWLIGADGQNSAVRRAAGLDAASREFRRF